MKVNIQFMGFTGLYYGLIMRNFEFLPEFESWHILVRLVFFGQLEESLHLSSCIYTCIHIFYSTIYFHNIFRVKALGSKTIRK